MVSRKQGITARSRIPPEEGAVMENCHGADQEDQIQIENAEMETTRGKKRLRVSRACGECRKRKDRCDGQQPSCSACLKAKRMCNYNPSSKKRGLRPGYVRSLEILLGLILHSVEGSEAWLSALLENEDMNKSSDTLLSVEVGRNAAESLCTRWRKSTLLKQIETFLDLAENIHPEEESTSTLDGRLATVMIPADYSSPSRPTLRLISIDEHPSILTAPLESATLPQMMKEAPAHFDPTQLPSCWSSLLDLYFAHTHCWIPVSPKHDVLRTAHLLASRPGALSLPDSISKGDCSFLWAALAYSSHYQESLKDNCESNPNLRNKNQCQHIYDVANSLLMDVHLDYEIGHVRALVLVALIQIERASWSDAWITIGRAVYIITCLELLPRRHELKSTTITDDQRRTILGCMITETIIAVRLNHRPYFASSDIKLIGLLQTDGMEEWEPWQPSMSLNQQSSWGNDASSRGPGHVLSIFNDFATLMGLMNALLQDSDPSSRDMHLEDIDQKLQNWQVRMSSHYHIYSNTGLSPQLLNLYLAFIGTYATLQMKLVDFSGKHTRTSSEGIPSHIQKACCLLDSRLGKIASHPIPSLTGIYLFSFNRCLELQGRVQSELGIQNEIKKQQASIEKIELAWQDALRIPREFSYRSRYDITMAQQQRTINTTIPELATPQSLRFNTDLPSSITGDPWDQELIQDQISQTGPFLQPNPSRNDLQQSVTGVMPSNLAPTPDSSYSRHITEPSGSSKELSSIESPFSNLQNQVERVVEPSVPHANLTPQENHLVEEQEDNLFDSLAVLDPDDW